MTPSLEACLSSLFVNIISTVHIQINFLSFPKLHKCIPTLRENEEFGDSHVINSRGASTGECDSERRAYHFFTKCYTKAKRGKDFIAWGVRMIKAVP